MLGSRASSAGSPWFWKYGSRDSAAPGVVTGASVVPGVWVEAVAAEALGAAADEEGERPGDAGVALPEQATAKEITKAAITPEPKRCF